MYTYIPSNAYFHTLGLKPCFFRVQHVERITAGTHHPSEQLGLPLHTAKGCQFTRHYMMVMQDTVELCRSPACAWLRSLIGFIGKPQLLLQQVLPNPLSQLRRQPAQVVLSCKYTPTSWVGKPHLAESNWGAGSSTKLLQTRFCWVSEGWCQAAHNQLYSDCQPIQHTLVTPMSVQKLENTSTNKYIT